jgi:preprotein translocase subunit SecG
MIALSTLTPVLRVLHLFVTLAMIGVVLIQRSEGGGLGIGTTQGMGSFMSGRGTANLLTRTTAILGTLFFAISLSLALLNRPPFRPACPARRPGTPCPDEMMVFPA